MIYSDNMWTWGSGKHLCHSGGIVHGKSKFHASLYTGSTATFSELWSVYWSDKLIFSISQDSSLDSILATPFLILNTNRFWQKVSSVDPWLKRDCQHTFARYCTYFIIILSMFPSVIYKVNTELMSVNSTRNLSYQHLLLKGGAIISIFKVFFCICCPDFYLLFGAVWISSFCKQITFFDRLSVSNDLKYDAVR